MSDALETRLSALVSDALKKAGCDGPLDEIAGSFEVPREERFGDLSTSAVFRIAKRHKKSPRALAEEVVAEISRAIVSTELSGRFERIAVEGPGFINFHYASSEISSVIERVRREGASYGKPAGVKPKKILLEYVSANPTGPLTVAHGRQAALGDSLARILEFCGHEVTREYYNNDEGVQITTLGKSTEHRVEELLRGEASEMPENFYKGEYLIETARQLLKETGADRYRAMDPKQKAELCRLYARDTIMAGIKKDLADFDVAFHNYYSQEALGKSGKVERTLEELKKKGMVYEQDGAVWLRSTNFGDDKDRVLVKSDGNYTYLTPDIAYHHEKYGRGFNEIINILGPDHHGYIARLKASQAALGHDPECLHVLIAQLVTLYEGDKQVRMSTRAGEFVTLRQILDEVGRDAGRFFFVMRKFDAHLDFDLALAKNQTPENPVFYIQYAHARIESIKNLWRESNGELPWDEKAPQCLKGEAEVRLMRLLGQFSEAVEGAARTLEPYRLVPYLMDLAAAFHRFYSDHRIVGEDKQLTAARLMLIGSAQAVIARGLSLLGVSAPLKM